MSSQDGSSWDGGQQDSSLNGGQQGSSTNDAVDTVSGADSDANADRPTDQSHSTGSDGEQASDNNGSLQKENDRNDSGETEGASKQEQQLRCAKDHEHQNKRTLSSPTDKDASDVSINEKSTGTIGAFTVEKGPVNASSVDSSEKHSGKLGARLKTDASAADSVTSLHPPQQQQPHEAAGIHSSSAVSIDPYSTATPSQLASAQVDASIGPVRTNVTGTADQDAVAHGWDDETQPTVVAHPVPTYDDILQAARQNVGAISQEDLLTDEDLVPQSANISSDTNSNIHSPNTANTIAVSNPSVVAVHVPIDGHNSSADVNSTGLHHQQQQSKGRFSRRALALVTVATVAVVAAIVALVVILTGHSGSSGKQNQLNRNGSDRTATNITSAPTSTVSSSPSAAPTDTVSDQPSTEPSARTNEMIIWDLIGPSLMGDPSFVNITDLDDPTSSAYRTLDWMANADNFTASALVSGTSSLSRTLLERYILVDLYFSLDGANWEINPNFLTNDHVCDWNTPHPLARVAMGATCTQDGFVNAVEVRSEAVSGTIPMSLYHLDLSVMHFDILLDVGTIPTVIGRLTDLEIVSLYYTYMTGTIPTEVGLLTNLLEFIAYTSALSGTIPTEIGNCENMQVFSVFGSFVTSTIPSEIGAFTDLTILDLAFTFLSGTVPMEIRNLQRLEFFSNVYTLNWGNLDPIFCTGRTSFPFLTDFASDCIPDDDSTAPATVCSCCTICCSSSSCISPRPQPFSCNKQCVACGNDVYAPSCRECPIDTSGFIRTQVCERSCSKDTATGICESRTEFAIPENEFEVR